MIYDCTIAEMERIYLIDSENLYSLNPFLAPTNQEFMQSLYSTDFR